MRNKIDYMLSSEEIAAKNWQGMLEQLLKALGAILSVQLFPSP